YSTIKSQRQHILGKLALEHLLNTGEWLHSLRWNEGLDVVQQVTRCSKTESPAIFRDLSRETGLVTEERVEETFTFIHLTFCEFMAAREAVLGDTDQWSRLFAAHRANSNAKQSSVRSRLLEVVPFAAALRSTRTARAEALTDIASLGDLQLTARTFLETKLY